MHDPSQQTFEPDPAISVRDAVEADLPAIVAIYNQAIPGRAANADLRLVTVESRREWFHAHAPDRRPLWVACRGDEVVGWIGLLDFLPRYAYHVTAEVSVYVSPDHQGRGLGAWLLQRMLAACPRMGVENLISLVFAHNTPSLKAHQRAGFQRWGLLPGVANLDDVRRDVVVLGWKAPTDEA